MMGPRENEVPPVRTGSLPATRSADDGRSHHVVGGHFSAADELSRRFKQ